MKIGIGFFIFSCAARVASRSIAVRRLAFSRGRWTETRLCIHGRRQSAAESLTGSAVAATACNLYIEKYALMAPNIELTRLDIRRLAARRFDCKCNALFVSILVRSASPISDSPFGRPKWPHVDTRRRSATDLLRFEIVWRATPLHHLEALNRVSSARRRSLVTQWTVVYVRRWLASISNRRRKSSQQ